MLWDQRQIYALRLKSNLCFEIKVKFMLWDQVKIYAYDQDQLFIIILIK